MRSGGTEHSYTRERLLALAGVPLARYANYHRRGQLPFLEGAGKSVGGRGGYRAHHVLLVAALSGLARENGVDNALAARLLSRAFAAARLGDGDLWLGLADSSGGASPAYAGGDLHDVVARLGAVRDADRILTWNLSATWREIRERARSLDETLPEWLSEVVAEGQLAEAAASGQLGPVDGLGRFQEAALSSITASAASATRRGFGTIPLATLREHAPIARALEAIGPGCATPDHASMALSTAAEEVLANLGEHGSEEWIDGSLVAGWLRTAAAEVWSCE